MDVVSQARNWIGSIATPLEDLLVTLRIPIGGEAFAAC